MNVFIHLKTIENAHDFFTPISIDGAINANADNFSSSEVIQIIKKLISESHKTLVFLELNDAHDSGVLPGILQTLLKYQNRAKICYSGINSKVLLMAKKLRAEEIILEDLERLALDYFNE